MEGSNRLFWSDADFPQNSVDETGVDFLTIARALDGLEERSLRQVAGILEGWHDSLAEQVSRASADGGLDALSRTLELPRRSDLLIALRAMLTSAWERGGRDARSESRGKQYAEWDETKHPRQPKGDAQGGEWVSGRWSDASVVARVREAIQVLPVDDKGKISLQAILGNRLVSSDTNKEILDQLGRTYERVPRLSRRLPVELSSLMYGQDFVRRSKLLEMLGAPGSVIDSLRKDPPQVVRTPSGDILMDGHHRVALAFLFGEKKMTLKVADSGKLKIEADRLRKEDEAAGRYSVPLRRPLFSSTVLASVAAGDNPAAWKWRYSEWDETKHPRVPRGSGDPSGEFAPQGEYGRAGTEVDGRTVREGIPNRASIEAGFNNYDVLPGLREVPLSAFDPEYLNSVVPDARTRKLAGQIVESGELNPLIVGIDNKGPYIVEGGHRFDALISLKARSFPALVVIDRDSVPRGAQIPWKHVTAYNQRSYADPSFTPDAALAWLADKAFWITNVVGDKLLNDAKGVIVSGLKTGKPLGQLLLDLAAVFEPYLGDEDIIRDEEQAQPYRLATIIRTNTTEAYNHGRLTEFVSPEMLPFLNGVRYSAVMDERTTEVCRFLDGKVFRPGSPDLEPLLPPNHFNAVVTGTLIETQRGAVPIEQVDVDDLVLTHRGRWRRVYAIMSKHSAAFRELHLSTGRILRLTDEHPVLTSAGWFRADGLQVGNILFQHGEEVPGSCGVGIRGPDDFPSLFNEGAVSYESARFTRCSSTITANFEANAAKHPREIDDVPADCVLEGKGVSVLAEQRGERGLVFGWLFSPGNGFPLRHLFHTVVGWVICTTHAFARCFGPVISFLASTPRPVALAAALGNYLGRPVGYSSLFLFGSHFDSKLFARSGQCGLAETERVLDGTDRFPTVPVPFCDKSLDSWLVPQVHSSPRWVGAAIIATVEVRCKAQVWNLAVEEDETYHAEGVVVHNCRSIIVPIVVGSAVDESEFITPAEVGRAKQLADTKFLAERQAPRLGCGHAQRQEEPRIVELVMDPKLHAEHMGALQRVESGLARVREDLRAQADRPLNVTVRREPDRRVEMDVSKTAAGKYHVVRTAKD